MSDIEVTQYGPRANGARAARFYVPGYLGEVEVQVLHHSEDMSDRVLEVARAMFDASAVLKRAERAEKLLALQAAETRAVRARLPPETPARLLGEGCVRFDADGRLWLLSRREDGWASFGVVCDGWDDLFRRYDVKVTAHGVDKDGPWWTVESSR